MGPFSIPGDLLNSSKVRRASCWPMSIKAACGDATGRDGILGGSACLSLLRRRVDLRGFGGARDVGVLREDGPTFESSQFSASSGVAKKCVLSLAITRRRAVVLAFQTPAAPVELQHS